MRLFFTLIFLLFSINSLSQEIKLTQYGVKAGPSYSNVQAENIEGPGENGFSGTDFYFGISMSTALTWNFNLRQEFLYLQIAETALLELPIMFEYNFIDKWSAIAGFHFSYAFENKSSLRDSLRQDTKNFGVGIGTGLLYDLNKNFFIEVRTSYGLTEQIANFNFVNGKPLTFRLGIGYLF